MHKSSILILACLLSSLSTWADNVIKLNPTTVQVNLPEGQQLFIDFYGQNIFRVFQDPTGDFIRDPESNPEAQILVEHPRKDVKLSLQGNSISTERLTITVDPANGSLRVTGKEVTPLAISPAEFQKGKTTLTLSQQENEYFFGGGVQNGRFSHKGQFIAIENTNNWVDGGVASPTPFYWSTAGYGVMAYTFTPGRYDFGASQKGKTVLMHETTYLDYFFMFDKSAVSLLNDFYQLTGNPVLLPKFGFYEGHLNAYNRDYWTEAKEGGFMAYEDGKRYNESQKDNGGIHESLNGELNGGANYQFSARAAIDRYLNNNYPLGWFLPNDGYGAGYGQTSTLDGNIQNLKEFGDYARSKGVEIGLWTQSDLHPKKDVQPLLQRDIIKEVRDAGVRVLKTDVAWVGAGYSFGLNGVADVAHIMPYYGGNARPFIISLDGWAGTQRYAGIWTGDQTGGEWEYIRFHIPTYIGSGLSGQPNITSDMDGIFGGKNTPVNVRDFQWKTFSPMQLNMDGWGRNPKYPQALGEPAATINRSYLHLKSMLMPYTYSIAHEAINGKPMIRPMFMEEENDYTLGKGTQYQFMYGPNLLVAPIYKATRAKENGDDVRDGIYLPQGEWMDATNGSLYEGGRIINDFDAPLWKLPIFIRKGAIIPQTEAHNTPNQLQNDVMQLYIIPGNKTTFDLYDDDGKTQAYLNGEFATTHIESELNDKKQLTVTIQPTKGTFDGFMAKKCIKVNIPFILNYGKITAKVDGKKVAVQVRESSTETIFAREMKGIEGIPAIKHLFLSLDAIDLTQHTITIQVDGLELETDNHLLSHHGQLSAPQCQVSEENRKAYSLTPSWQVVNNADYYEIMFNGMLYSTIHACEYELTDLTPLVKYDIKVRAVNADGASEWTAFNATTTDDPLRDAIRGASAETSCKNQGGQGVGHLLDFDETSTWHTEWQTKAVPFDLTIDLHSVNILDKLEYLPRPDAGNGTLLQGTYQVSKDKITWSDPVSFTFARDASTKQILFSDHPTARFIRFHITEGVGGFGSGQQMYIFRQPGSEYYIPGDINLDGRIDENDLTSYMNYTGLRQGDSDFEGYVSKGDLNGNGLIDAYDISAVAIELETGVSSRKVPAVEGTVSMKQTQQGDEVLVTITGHGMKSVNAVSLCIPYDATQLEYVGIEPTGVKQMYNMTNDRLHTNGQKALYPTFVNLGEQPYTEGDTDLMTIRFRAKQGAKFKLEIKDVMLVDKYQGVASVKP